MSDNSLKRAAFAAKVKSYWLIAGGILAAISPELLKRKLVVKRGVFF